MQVLFVGSLLLPCLTGLVLDRSGAGDRLFVNLGLVVLAVAGWFAIQTRARRGRSVSGFLSIAILSAMLLTPELVLRQVGFRYETGIQFGYPTLTRFESFVAADDLLWTLRPGAPNVNSWGFPGEEIEIPKPADTYRMLFLGDSVTQQGYPALVESRLNRQGRLPRRAESVSLSLAGYSSYQGRILADTYGGLLEPELVVVSYGWNDHWQAYGEIDSEKTIDLDQSGVGRLSREIQQRSRLMQGLGYLSNAWLGTDRPLSVMRVPLDEYLENLSAIAESFAVRHTPVIFITPPASHQRLGVPDYLVDDGFAVDKASVVRLHQQYNEVVRQVAGMHPVHVLDLERDWASRPDLARMFIEDGIHLTDEGSALVANAIVDAITALQGR